MILLIIIPQLIWEVLENARELMGNTTLRSQSLKSTSKFLSFKISINKLMESTIVDRWKEILRMEKEFIIKVEMNTKVTSKTIFDMGSEFKNTRMEMSILAIGRQIWEKDGVSKRFERIIDMKDTFWMIRFMEMGNGQEKPEWHFAEAREETQRK